MPSSKLRFFNPICKMHLFVTLVFVTLTLFPLLPFPSPPKWPNFNTRVFLYRKVITSLRFHPRVTTDTAGKLRSTFGSSCPSGISSAKSLGSNLLHCPYGLSTVRALRDLRLHYRLGQNTRTKDTEP